MKECELNKGVMVKVIKGRNIPKGTIGEIKWWGEAGVYWEQGNYGWHKKYVVKVGLKISGCDHLRYTYLPNLEVVK